MEIILRKGNTSKSHQNVDQQKGQKFQLARDGVKRALELTEDLTDFLKSDLSQKWLAVL